MEKQSFKNSVGTKITKFLIGGAASIGAGAVVGCVARNQNLGSLKGLGKLFAGVGIAGLSAWAGNEARAALEAKVDDAAEIGDMVADAISSVSITYSEPETEEDKEEVTVTKEEIS